MAFITARDGIVAIFQGSAETGPRALGHRSIVANACNPRTRDLLNERSQASRANPSTGSDGNTYGRKGSIRVE